jgi:hypothetical protein
MKQLLEGLSKWQLDFVFGWFHTIGEKGRVLEWKGWEATLIQTFVGISIMSRSN